MSWHNTPQAPLGTECLWYLLFLLEEQGKCPMVLWLFDFSWTGKHLTFCFLYVNMKVGWFLVYLSICKDMFYVVYFLSITVMPANIHRHSLHTWMGGHDVSMAPVVPWPAVPQGTVTKAQHERLLVTWSLDVFCCVPKDDAQGSFWSPDIHTIWLLTW